MKKLFKKQIVLAGLVGLSLLVIAKISADDQAGHPAATQPATQPTPEAKVQPAECGLKEPAVVAEDKNIGSLSYFISHAGSGIAYISLGGNYYKEYGSEKSIKIPGSVDPVFSPDGSFLTVPGYSVPHASPTTQPGAQSTTQPAALKQKKPTELFYGTPLMETEESLSASPATKAYKTIDTSERGLAFFDMDAIRDSYRQGKDASDLKPLFVDRNMQSSYQSVGVLATKDGKTRYRAIADNLLQDYDVDAKKSVTPVYGSPKTFCEGIDYDSRNLPMLSKDGKYVSLYNAKAQSSKIYRLSDDDPSKCTEVLDTGLPTGKIDFSSDNSKITFHVDNYGTTSSTFNAISDKDSKDTYVLYLKQNDKKEIAGIEGISRLTIGPVLGSGVYYPRFNQSGDLVAAKDDQSKFSLIKLDPAKVPILPYYSRLLQDSASKDKKVLARLALGALWNEVCKNNGNGDAKIPSFTQSQFIAHGLDPDDCRSLVKKYWDKQNQEAIKHGLNRLKGVDAISVNELKVEDLTAVCPEKTQAFNDVKRFQKLPAPPGSDYGQSGGRQGLSTAVAQKFLESGKAMVSTCTACHANASSAGGSAFVFDMTAGNAVSQRAMLERAISNVATGKMPPVTINSDDRMALLNYLLIWRSTGAEPTVKALQATRAFWYRTEK